MVSDHAYEYVYGRTVNKSTLVEGIRMNVDLNVILVGYVQGIGDYCGSGAPVLVNNQ
jgi:hypothetical protein